MGFKKYKWHKVAESAADIKWTAGDVGEVELDGKMICIGKFNEELYGFAHVCPHAGAPMINAYIDGGCHVICPVHHLKFNLKNGQDVKGGGYRIKTYPVELRADGVYVGMPDGAGLFKWL